MNQEFLKQLIALLAQSGGSISLPLADLQQLGVEVTLDALGSASATVRLRLGAKIYYVPQAQRGDDPTVRDKVNFAAEDAWPTTPEITPEKIPTTSPKLRSILDAQIDAVNQLNNRPRQPTTPREGPRPSPPSVAKNSPNSPQSSPPPQSHPPLPPLTEAARQESLTGPPPSSRRVVPKTDMDLFLREQAITRQKQLSQARKDQADARRGRQYPWETRNAPPLKLQ